MEALWHRLWERFWVLPALCCVAAFVLGATLPELDDAFVSGNVLVFGGGPDGARSLLSAIVTSMISVTGLVFSITVVSLQLASSQFSPRVLRAFLDSRITQLTLGFFAGTFLYSLVVLRSVRGDSDVPAFVPQLSVTGAFVLVVASVGMFVVYIHHITNSIRVVTIISAVGDDTRSLIARLQDGDDSESGRDPGLGAPTRVITSSGHGVVTEVRRQALVRRAEHSGVVLEVLPAIGDFVASGMPLVAVHDRRGPAGDLDGDVGGGLDDDAVRDAVRLEPERSMQEDIGFGFRQLVDVAERALSPGINDPTTAIQVIDELHDLLRRLAAEPDPGSVHTDGDGQARLVVRRIPFAGVLRLAVEEIAHYGRDAVRIRPRLDALLDDLASVAAPEHRSDISAVRRQLASADA